jgi:hypothetical protein
MFTVLALASDLKSSATSPKFTEAINSLMESWLFVRVAGALADFLGESWLFVRVGGSCDLVLVLVLVPEVCDLELVPEVL